MAMIFFKSYDGHEVHQVHAIGIILYDASQNGVVHSSGDKSKSSLCGLSVRYLQKLMKRARLTLTGK